VASTAGSSCRAQPGSLVSAPTRFRALSTQVRSSPSSPSSSSFFGCFTHTLSLPSVSVCVRVGFSSFLQFFFSHEHHCPLSSALRHSQTTTPFPTSRNCYPCSTISCCLLFTLWAHLLLSLSLSLLRGRRLLLVVGVVVGKCPKCLLSFLDLPLCVGNRPVALMVAVFMCIVVSTKRSTCSKKKTRDEDGGVCVHTQCEGVGKV